MAVPNPPSMYILRKAWQLGRKMASREARICPDLADCRRHGAYTLFQQYHRHQMEAHPAFDRWEQKLQALADREANSRGLRAHMSRNWTEFHDHIVAPIHNAFWTGWEDVAQLKKLYLARREEEYDRQQRQRLGGSARVPAAERPPLQPTVEEEATHWTKATHYLAPPSAADDLADLPPVFGAINRQK